MFDVLMTQNCVDDGDPLLQSGSKLLNAEMASAANLVARIEADNQRGGNYQKKSLTLVGFTYVGTSIEVASNSFDEAMALIAWEAAVAKAKIIEACMNFTFDVLWETDGKAELDYINSRHSCN